MRDVLRSELSTEETRLEPLLALRAATGVALLVGPALWLGSPAYAASAALGAFSAGGATFQRAWRPRKVIALGAGAGLGLSCVGRVFPPTRPELRRVRGYRGRFRDTRHTSLDRSGPSPVAGRLRRRLANVPAPKLHHHAERELLSTPA